MSVHEQFIICRTNDGQNDTLDGQNDPLAEPWESLNIPCKKVLKPSGDIISVETEFLQYVNGEDETGGTKVDPAQAYLDSIMALQMHN